MQRKSGAGINLIFFVLVLLLVGALAAIGVYTYFHESEHEAKPASAPSVTETTEETTTSTTTTGTTATTSTTSVTTTTTTTSSALSKLTYHGYNETVAAKPSEAVLTLTEEESGSLFHYYPNSEWSFRDFADKAAVGIEKDKESSSESYYINGSEVKSSKSDIGFTAEIKDGKALKVESYGGELTELRIVSNNDKYADISYTADIKKGTLEADLYDSTYTNGFYVINGEYTVKDKTVDLNIYLFVNCKSDDEKDYSYYLCTGSQSTTLVTTTAEVTTTTTTITTKKAD